MLSLSTWQANLAYVSSAISLNALVLVLCLCVNAATRQSAYARSVVVDAVSGNQLATFLFVSEIRDAVTAV
jgi:hypothetical protein